MELSDADPPRHNVVDSAFGRESSIIVVLCNGVKFFIEVEAVNLQGTVFAEEYMQLAEPLQHPDQDDECYEAMCDWMTQPCFSIFRDRTTPILVNQNFTLHDFYYPPTLRVRLLVLQERLVAECFDGPHQKIEDNLTIPSTQLPDFPRVARIKASTIQALLDGKCNDDYCEVPQRVRLADGVDCYFKPVFNRSQYVREVHTLGCIAQANLAHLRVSKLVGIVISDDAKDTIGLLVKWIPSIGDLQNAKVKNLRTAHDRWRTQVELIVAELHKHNIIWGDVHPGNILIDMDLNAWAIDFGGGWIEPFVPRKLRDTIEGDLHGVKMVFKHLETETPDDDDGNTSQTVESV